MLELLHAIAVSILAARVNCKDFCFSRRIEPVRWVMLEALSFYANSNVTDTSVSLMSEAELSETELSNLSSWQRAAVEHLRADGQRCLYNSWMTDDRPRGWYSTALSVSLTVGVNRKHDSNEQDKTKETNVACRLNWISR